MKHLIIMFMVIGAIMMFFGCSEDNPIEPVVNQNDQVPAALAKEKAAFTGTCKFVQPIEPGTSMLLPNGKTLAEGEVAEWKDEASDPRVTGKSIWYINKKLESDGTGKIWGKAELIVDNDGGKWEMTWHGWVTDVDAIGEAIGTGKEGAVKGMVAKWTYTMTFADGFYYVSKGEIFEK